MKLIQEEHDARQHSVGASDGFRGNQYTKVVSGENDQLPTEADQHALDFAKTQQKTRYQVREGADYDHTGT